MKKLFLIVFILSSCFARQEPMYFITMRKSGTHLLEKYLRLVICQNDKKYQKVKEGIDRRYVRSISSCGKKIYFKHLCTEELQVPVIPPNRKKIILLRDPRDVLISSIYFFPKMPQGKRDETIKNYIEKWDKSSFEDKLTSLLLKPKQMPSCMRVHIDQFNKVGKVLSMKNTLIVFFEDLVGENGGGSDERQYHAMEQIAEFINVPFDQTLYQKIKEDLFGSSKTFRKGKIGSWKDHFTKEHKRLFKEQYGDLLILLGYEKDFSW